ncbi:hypothetical protein DEU56DRAFT_811598 [Suillus clintonianus]|uniref:uncharacterized protein n=1 Tax=Suillus clintonianus TaxID=1904413 RepID=UPI001B872FD8|nr:uncharacterized protein DEU56DRAFT_811598 [Suillus clintonianus]KAG2132975.1 hypothetical protein DEU56DRAFT_811598 [Suillus clintonianus]
MIEPKIFDQNDEHFDASEPAKTHLLHPPQPLRINTNTITDMKRVLRERTNLNTPVALKGAISPDISANVYHTPNSSRACGRPSPTMKPGRFNKATSICGSSTDSLRRQRRYSVAEQALEYALKNCTSERSPRELQILALEKATAALSTRANESRDRAAKLRACLADRAVDPKSYAALQSDRWMAERRQSAADREVRQMSHHLALLKLKRGAPEQGRFDENLPVTPLDNEARRRANLVRFFERSPTRTSLHTHHKCRPLFVDCTFSRRITMSDISPLRLRPSTSATRRFTTQHARPKSIGNEPPAPFRRSGKPRLASGPSRPSMLVRNMGPSNAEYSSTSLSQSSTPSSRLLPFNDQTDDVMTSTRPSTPPLSIASTSSNGASHVSRVPLETPQQAPSGGVATIYASSSPRSHTEILADLDRDSVRVPEYAVNLLEGFDLIHHDITLPERSISLKPREEEPETGVPRPSEESDTGPYTSFALPPFQPEPLWSHTSLNTPSTPRSHVQTLHPLSSGSSTPSGLSTPTATRPPAPPSRPHSLLFLMRKRKDLQYSPASSVTNLDGDSARGSKRRFSLFTRK